MIIKHLNVFLVVNNVRNCKNGRKSVHGKIQKWSQKCTWGGRKSVHIVIDNTVIDKGKP